MASVVSINFSTGNRLGEILSSKLSLLELYDTPEGIGVLIKKQASKCDINNNNNSGFNTCPFKALIRWLQFRNFKISSDGSFSINKKHL